MAFDLKSTSMQEIIDYYRSNPTELDELMKSNPGFGRRIESWIAAANATEAYRNGTGSANDILYAFGEAGNSGLNMTPEYEQWLQNEIARENTRNDQSYQTQMRDTSLLSTAEQLSQLGLSSSNVIQVGGASSGVTSAAASTSHHSIAAMNQQERINHFNQKMGLAKSLIGAAGSMASSGIYGAALGAIKNSAAKMATSAAHSGLDVLKKYTPQAMTENDNAEWNNIMQSLGY